MSDKKNEQRVVSDSDRTKEYTPDIDTDNQATDKIEIEREIEVSREHIRTGISVGAMLAKERILRMLTIDSIAEALKLSPVYIRAIEENDFTSLPSSPYIRAYVKALGGHLSLDVDALLLQLARDQKSDSHSYEDDSCKTLTIKIQEEQKKNSGISILILALLLTLFAYFIISNNQEELLEESVYTTDSLEDVEAMVNSEDLDSLLPQTPVLQPETGTKDSIIVVVEDVANEQDSSLTTDIPLMIFTVHVIKDSSWVAVFADGEKVLVKTLHPSQTHTFTAKDSINMRVGSMENIRSFINDKPLTSSKTGICNWYITPEKITTWKTSKWNQIFDKRILEP